MNFIHPNRKALEATGPLTKPLKIVWVEDCPCLQELIKSLIQDAFKGVEILTFANGDAALAQLERESPDLLISDLIHLGMDGFEMLTRLSQKNVAYPIVIVSGILPERERWARHCAGQRLKVHYIPKPFINEHFIKILEQCLNRPCSKDSLIRWIGSIDRPLKIVQLDDTDFVLEYVAKLLQRCFQKLQLFQFQNSSTAWKILTQAEPDLLITGDIMQPDLEWNGENIVRCLVERKVGFPIIVMSGWPQTQLWTEKLRAEHRRLSFLPKPFTPNQFYRELGRFFRPLNPPNFWG